MHVPLSFIPPSFRGHGWSSQHCVTSAKPSLSLVSVRPAGECIPAQGSLVPASALPGRQHVGPRLRFRDSETEAQKGQMPAPSHTAGQREASDSIWGAEERRPPQPWGLEFSGSWEVALLEVGLEVQWPCLAPHLLPPPLAPGPHELPGPQDWGDGRLGGRMWTARVPCPASRGFSARVFICFLFTGLCVSVYLFVSFCLSLRLFVSLSPRFSLFLPVCLCPLALPSSLCVSALLPPSLYLFVSLFASLHLCVCQHPSPRLWRAAAASLSSSPFRGASALL